MSFFAGLLPLVWHFGLGGAGVIAGLLFYVFSPLGKKLGLIFAVIVGLATFAYGIGVNNGESRIRAQDAANFSALNNEIDTAIRNAARAVPAVVPLPAPARPAAAGRMHAKPKPKPLDRFDRG